MKNIIIILLVSGSYLLAMGSHAAVSESDAAACGARKLSFLHGGGFGIDPNVVDKLVKDKKIAEANLCIKFANEKCEKYSTEFGDKSLMMNVFTKFPMKSGTGVAKLYNVTKDRCDFRYEPNNNTGRVTFSIRR